MNDLVTSWIRTFVPVGVAAVLTWLAANANIVIDDGASAGLTAGVVALVTAAYYVVARALESRFPKFGVLLGATKQPAYQASHRSEGTH
jgi:hypothetical protein